VALTLNTTLADEKANSYVDIPYADDYFLTYSTDTLVAGQWSALTDDQKTHKLIQSCRILETLHFTEPVDPLTDWRLVYDSRNQQVRSVKTNYGRPQKYNYWQKLQFPRTLDVYMEGTLYVPEEIQLAQCEQAGYLMNFDSSLIANRLQGVSRESVNIGGGIAISQKLEANGSMISPVAYQYAKPYLIKSNMRLQRS
jgi:hypothetical protein